MKASKTQGFYTFADGFEVWYNGMNGTMKRYLTKEHGPIIKFVHTNL